MEGLKRTMTHQYSLKTVDQEGTFSTWQSPRNIEKDNPPYIFKVYMKRRNNLLKAIAENCELLDEIEQADETI